MKINSYAELETQLMLCKKLFKLKNLDYNKSESLLNEIQRMLNVLIKNLEART